MTDDNNDRFQGVDKAIERVRKELDEAVDESKQATEKARKEVRESIDELEQRVEKLRKRNKE